MVLSSRLIVAVGLGVVGAGLLVAPIQGQQDGAVRKTNGGASQFKEGTAPVIGTIDLDGVFKNYEKVKYANEEFQGALKDRQGQLMKLQQEMVQEAELLQRFTPGQEDFKKQENKLTEMKAKLEAGREQAEREFQSREAEAMASLYNEVTEVAKKIAKARKMTYVMKVTNQTPSGANPNSVMAAMSNPMIYFDPANDITQDVVYNLNAVYKAAGGPTAKAATPPAGAPGAPAGAAAPASAAAPKASLR
ncbi:OmpH family outer membrane protein [Paludisphaera soli]|uniref:OmpH family outer membrane protein n=1 Tax=Paludisphaera soli TaxID=2712865 RepID=UPI0013ED3082|nr:OmpH family outer membrane protein [Paludisphaera soli]